MPSVFVSYAHDDEIWFGKIVTTLETLKLSHSEDFSFEILSDKQLDVGDIWEQKLAGLLKQADHAILIITEKFLASTYIRTKELPYLEKAVDEGKILGVVCEPCPISSVPFLLKIQLFPALNKPLGALPEYEQKEKRTEFYNILDSKIKKLKSGGQETEDAPVGSDKGGGDSRAGEDKASWQSSIILEVRITHRFFDQYKVIYRVFGGQVIEPALPTDLKINVKQELSRESFSDINKLSDTLFNSIAPKAGVAEVLLSKTVERIRNSKQSNLIRLRVVIEPSAGELYLIPWESMLLSSNFKHIFKDVTINFERYASSGNDNWDYPSIRAEPSQYRAILQKNHSDTQKQTLSRIEAMLSQKSLKIDVSYVGDKLEDISGVDSNIVFITPDIIPSENDFGINLTNKDGSIEYYSAEQVQNEFHKSVTTYQIIVIDSSRLDVPELGKHLLRLASIIISTGPCAVITWQSEMNYEIWVKFLENFIIEFGKGGDIVHSTAVARACINDTVDVWKPVVLTRLKTGKAWYQPRLQGAVSGDPWSLIQERIQKSKIIPVIGPGVSTYLMQSRRHVAETLAKKCDFPLGKDQHGNLQKVTQYLETTKEREHMISALIDVARDHGLEKYVDAKELENGVNLSVEEAMKTIWSSISNKSNNDPYKKLAELECPLYITTNYHDFLSRALAEKLARKPYEIRDRVWSSGKSEIIGQASDADERMFNISPENPIVHYLFGRFDISKSLTLTEDDYFKFLLSFKSRWNSLPLRVRETFDEYALMFLGFDLDDWDFRCLFRAFLDLEGALQMRKIPHVAVQVTPDDDRLNDPKRTQEYLIQYFRQISEKPLIFMGTADDILNKLVP